MMLPKGSIYELKSVGPSLSWLNYVQVEVLDLVCRKEV